MPRPSLYSIWTQIRPPKPNFTEQNVPDLNGKICIVTGSNTGVGKELARILYAKNAKVYVAARSEVKAKDAIEDIKRSAPSSKGELVFLHLDLNDLSTIKASAQNFLAKENRLHILFNNAGVMMPPRGSKTAQGYELQLGVNNIAPFMFTKLLTPVIVSTARVESQNTVRVIWVSSSAAEVLSPKSIIPMDNLDYHIDQSSEVKYGISKAGNYLHAAEFAKRHKADGIISVALNPGNLSSDLVRHQGTFTKLFLKVFIQYPTVYGAYTELFAGLSPEVTIERSADWIIPFGRFLPIREDIANATRTKAEGGTEVGLKFWEWCEDQIKSYI